MKKLRFLISGLLGLTLAVCGCDSSTEVIDPPPINPIARVATYLLSADRTGGVGVYTVDPSSGDLRAVDGSPFPADHPLITLAVHPSGRLVYAGSDDQPFLEGYSLDPPSGRLTRLPGYPIPSLADGSPLFDNAGEFLYVVGESAIDGFRVNAGSGALLHLVGFPLAVPGMQAATTPQMSPDDRFLYVSDPDTDQLFAFSRNLQTGSLALIQQVASGGDGPTGLGLTPDGRFLYAAHADGTLPGFAVAADGTLTALAGPAPAYAAGPTLSYTLGFLEDAVFVGDAAASSLNAFRIGANGALTQLPGYPRGGGGAGVFVYPFFFADLLYVSNGASNRINAFTVNDDESVQVVPGSPFPGSGAPAELEAAVVSF